MSEQTMLYPIERIMEMIPHRYPFLLIDRVIECEKDQHAVAVKNVSVNEGLFQGHFPTMKVFPGVLIVEAMAQTSAILVVDTLGKKPRGNWFTLCRLMNANSASPSLLAIKCIYALKN